jgi:hypothetical protein
MTSTPRTVTERVRLAHFGDAHHSGHIANSAFDYYCVAAHGEDFRPKYLEGEVCHDGMGEGYCHPNCRQCIGSECPIEPCPLVDEYGDVPMTSTPRTEAPQTGVWHEGHVMGGYLNPACASCRWPNSEGEGEVYVRLDDALDEAEAATPPALDRDRDAKWWLEYVAVGIEDFIAASEQTDWTKGKNAGLRLAAASVRSEASMIPAPPALDRETLRENPDAKALIDGWHLTNGAIDAMNAALSKSFPIYDDPEAGTDVDGDSVTVMDRLMENGYVVASWEALRAALGAAPVAPGRIGNLGPGPAGSHTAKPTAVLRPVGGACETCHHSPPGWCGHSCCAAPAPEGSEGPARRHGDEEAPEPRW